MISVSQNLISRNKNDLVKEKAINIVSNKI